MSAALLMKDHPGFVYFTDILIASFRCDGYFDLSVCMFERMPTKRLLCRKPWT